MAQVNAAPGKPRTPLPEDAGGPSTAPAPAPVAGAGMPTLTQRERGDEIRNALRAPPGSAPPQGRASDPLAQPVMHLPLPPANLQD